MTKVIQDTSLSVLAMVITIAAQSASAQSTPGQSPAPASSSDASANVAGQTAPAQIAATPPVATVPTQVHAEESNQTLGDIVVTARRREESLQSVPVSITAISGADLQRRNIVSIGDLQGSVPGLQTRTSASSRQQVSFRIRGLGQAIAGSLPSVVTYFEDVPTNAAGPGLLYDLENVQVLKGPQGTLFGRNTTGGAVLINPRRPTDELGGYADISVGDYAYRRLQGALNLPVSDTLSVRVAADSNQRRGFTLDTGSNAHLDGRDYFDWRVGVLFKPTNFIENYFVYDQYQSDTTSGSLILQKVRPGSPADIRFPGFLAFLAAQQQAGNRQTTTSMAQPYDQSRARSATNVLTVKLNDQILIKNILGYREFRQRFTADTDSSPFRNLELIPASTSLYTSGSFSGTPSQRVHTAELQVQGSKLFNVLDLIVGAFYEKSKPYSSTDTDHFLSLGVDTFRQALRYEDSKAIFSQGTLNLGGFVNGLSVTAGGRYTKDGRSIKAADINSGVCQTVLPNDGCYRSLSRSFDQFTYNLSADYHVSRDLLVYVAHRKGYKSGGFNQAAALTTTAALSYGPEKVFDIEAGIKSEFKIGSRAVRINGALFQSSLIDVQRTTQVLFGTSTAVVTTNDGTAKIDGAEVEITAVPIDNLRLSGFYAFTRARYKIPALVNTPFTIVPRNKFGLSAEYQIELTGAGSISPSLTYAYQSLTHTSNNPDNNDIQLGYGLLDGRIEWRSDNSGVSAYAFISNITNKEYQTSNVNLYASLGFTAAAFGDPRTFGVGVRYAY